MDFGRESGNQAAAEQLVYDYRRANLSDDDVALCEYAVKLTLTPGAMGREDVQRLRDRGFEDASITVATQVIGYFNYINRVADGLGVDDEEWMTIPHDQWHAERAKDYLEPMPARDP
jgi:uncharacterized peroxidase-related enzyme